MKADSKTVMSVEKVQEILKGNGTEVTEEEAHLIISFMAEFAQLTLGSVYETRVEQTIIDLRNKKRKSH